MDPNNIPNPNLIPSNIDEQVPLQVMSWFNDDDDEKLLRLFLKRRQKKKQEGSSSTRRPRIYIERNRVEGHNQLVNDYFSEQPVYTDVQFRRRYRMRKHVFLRIVEALGERDEYFQNTIDAAGKPSLSPLQKCTPAIRMLAYGATADSVDDYLRIGESTAIECLDRFAEGVMMIFGAIYLRRPTNEDTERLLRMGEARGWPGMLGSIDCMHWEWKNCPVGWKGQFSRGDHGKPTIMLEAVASQDLWIWHAFFGVAGSNNDLNVLNQSNVFSDHMEGRAPTVHFKVNGNDYNLGYYLADGIYPEWATFVKAIHLPQGEKKQLFAERQASARKDIERAFGVLQARFAIIRYPARKWHIDALKRIMLTCIILHNMIVEDERDTYGGNVDYSYDHANHNIAPPEEYPRPNFQAYLDKRAEIRERQTHQALRNDLIQHIWDHQNENN